VLIGSTFYSFSTAQRSLPAALVLSTGGLILFWWALTRPAARAFFEEKPDG